MKRIVLAVAILVMICAGAVWADSYSFKEQVISVEQKAEYLEVTIRNKQVKEPMIYRIWPCGKVDVQEWKEIQPNKERQGNWYSSPNIILTPSYTTDTGALTLENGTGWVGPSNTK